MKWREADEKERLWVVALSHPIAEGIGEYIELEKEEMYGEHFDIPAPDELIFTSWFEGGEVFRSGCTYTRGSGIIGTLAASWAYVGQEDNSTIIYSEKAILRLEDDPTYLLVVQYANGEAVNYQLGKIQSNAEGDQNNSHIVEQFVNFVLYDKEPPVNGEEGMKSLEVILAALQSSETKQIVSVKAAVTVE